jgi:hypothetical protein
MTRNTIRAARVAIVGLVLTVTLITGGVVSALAQDVQPQAKKTPTPFREMKISPASLAFAPITFGTTAASQARSFSIEDTGTAALTVTVGNPATSEFAIIQGAGQTRVEPTKGSALLVTVLFAPGAAGTFSDAISITSDATRANANATVKLKGSARGTPTSSIFVTDFETNDVNAFPTNANGNVEPTVAITGANSSLFAPVAIAFDSNDNIYVANSQGGTYADGSINVYAAGGNGNAAPSAVIVGPDTGLADPRGIALDSLGNIYVANEGDTEPPTDGSITEYPAGSNGDVTPIATITGVLTQALANPVGIAVEPSTGDIYVSNLDGITVYPAGSNGEATPSAIIAGPDTGFESPGALALNPVNGDIYTLGLVNSGNAAKVQVYPAGSNGDVAPTATIMGRKTRLSEFAGGIALDSSGTIYVTTTFLSAGRSGIAVYAAGSNGDVPPVAKIAGPHTGLSPMPAAVGASGIAIMEK